MASPEPFRGEVWDVRFPSFGEHPAVVLSINALNSRPGHVAVHLRHGKLSGPALSALTPTRADVALPLRDDEGRAIPEHHRDVLADLCSFEFWRLGASPGPAYRSAIGTEDGRTYRAVTIGTS